MMKVQLGISARDKRTLTVGAVTVVSLFVLAKGLPTSLAWQNERIADAIAVERKVERSRVSVRVMPSLRDSVRARRLRIATLDSTIVSGGSAAAAAAAVSSFLQDIADSARIKISAMQLRPDSAKAGSLTTIAVRVTGTTDIAGLAAFLRAVESNDTPMLVRELSASQPDPTAGDARGESLRVDLLVQALARVTSSTTGQGRIP
ncbi:MAG: GspMb/PilO family protein [Gemmatimonadaceae bacterium]